MSETEAGRLAVVGGDDLSVDVLVAAIAGRSELEVCAGKIGGATWTLAMDGAEAEGTHLPDHTSLGDVLDAVSAAAAGQPLVLRPSQEPPRKHASLLDSLTARERRVLDHLATGRSDAAIAEELGVSPHTIRTHVQNLRGKLDAPTRLEAVALARELSSTPTSVAHVRPDASRADHAVTIGARGRLRADLLGWCVDQVAGCAVVAWVPDGASQCAAVAELQPALALLDHTLGPDAQAEACIAIKSARPETRVLLVAADADAEHLARCVHAGADAYVRPGRASEVSDAVEATLQGQALVPPDMLGGLLRDLIEQRRQEDELIERYSRLSDRERGVLALLTEGLDQDRIADRLVVSPHTARTHIQNILRKLEVHSRLEAVALVMQHDLLDRFPAGRGET